MTKAARLMRCGEALLTPPSGDGGQRKKSHRTVASFQCGGQVKWLALADLLAPPIAFWHVLDNGTVFD